MNAAVVHSFDAPPDYASFDPPVPQDGERLVTVTAAGLHPIVKALATGSHYGSSGELPFVPGVDGVGRLEDGSRVYFGISRAPFGSFAQQALAAGSMTVPVPDGLDDATAAAIANPAMSSWVALDRGGYITGQSILILGATGTAGQLAVQIARLRGAGRVVAAGRNAQALAEVQALGADAVISLEQDRDALVAAFRGELSRNMDQDSGLDSGRGIDLVLDYLWGAPAQALLAAISQKGLRTRSRRVRYVQIGNSAGAEIPLPAAALRSSGLELLGSGFGSASLEQIRQAISDFFELAVKKPLHFNLKTAPLSEVETLWNEKEQATRLIFQP